jgi:hypothetical protein
LLREVLRTYIRSDHGSIDIKVHTLDGDSDNGTELDVEAELDADVEDRGKQSAQQGEDNAESDANESIETLDHKDDGSKQLDDKFTARQ